MMCTLQLSCGIRKIQPLYSRRYVNAGAESLNLISINPYSVSINSPARGAIYLKFALQARRLLEPGTRLLQLAGEAEEGGLRPHASHELHADRQSGPAPRQRHGHGRLSCVVKGLGVGHEGEQAL